VELRKRVPDADEDWLTTGEGVSRGVSVERGLAVVISVCEAQLVREAASEMDSVLVGELVGQNDDVIVASSERDCTEDGSDDGETEGDTVIEIVEDAEESIEDETGALRVVVGDAVVEAFTETDGGTEEVDERDCSAGVLENRAEADCVVDSIDVPLSATLAVNDTDSDLHGEEEECALSDLLALSESALPVWLCAELLDREPIGEEVSAPDNVGYGVADDSTL